MHQGMAYCPEDRKVEGIIADLSVRENMILALQAKTRNVQTDEQKRTGRVDR